ncbi:hypothetical protein FOZ60_015378 [Perkinsus olseni]|uniref:phosphoglucomutase (alpha-D-glucose-1,6-bisphosphate-dependent) n=3 Tax=Perkinsus olseni TaxID=32597 RepID=A0A7J6P6R0_PEROL|nr:hypothetical protein FOZ60_015378 [Perkinsus olseni]
MSLRIHKVPTKPIEGQKTGTSGLRKKTAVITGTPNYIENWLQCLFTSIGDDLKGKTLVIGGDGRYHNSVVAQTAIRMGFANGVKRFVVGKNGILSTPGVSAVIRERGLFGGIIMTASHNPGGPNADWGIKYNCENGGPAPEKVTDKIYDLSQVIEEYSIADLEVPVDLARLGEQKFPGDCVVEVIDPFQIWVDLMKKCFDFEALRKLVARPDFTLLYDGLNAVTGPYARKVFVEELGAPETSIVDGTPLEDFGGAHPDPNLTYAHGLVEKMDTSKNPNAPVFGAASDGDGDRNMVLGRDWFVSPSDSLAIIFDYAAQGAIPYFNKVGLPGVARSMPTSRAVDVVSKARGIPCYQTPTGWKFFGNLMDANKVSLCGEESFGTGSNVIREKDGLFSILCWLSILAFRNQDATKPLVGVREINEDHWRRYGRHFYTRCDYEGVESDAADRMFDHIRGEIADKSLAQGVKLGEGWTVAGGEEYRYVDPIDGSVAEKQGLIITFDNGGRIVFRLSGTGSAGATIRLYMELYEKDFDKDRLPWVAGGEGFSFLMMFRRPSTLIVCVTVLAVRAGVDDIPLNYYPILMTHDAAMGYLENSSEIIHRCSKNQVGNLYQQLSCGARAFDLRPACVGEDVVVHHGLQVVHVPLKSVLEDAMRWAQENPDEIIFVRLGLYGPDTAECKARVPPILSELKLMESLGSPGVPCSRLDGMTVGGAKELSRTPVGGHVFVYERDCGEDHGGSHCHSTDSSGAWSVHCYTAFDSSRPSEKVEDFLNSIQAVSQLTPNGSKFLTNEAHWQYNLDQFEGVRLASSSLLMDEYFSRLNHFLVERIDGLSNINMLQVENVCDHGLELNAKLKERATVLGRQYPKGKVAVS